MADKKTISLDQATRLINPGVVVLVTSAYKDKKNIMTLAWCMPVSKNPPLAAISVAKTHLTHELIKSSGEFIINIPDVSILDKVHKCGTVSGTAADKFELAGLTAQKALKVKAPVIKECIAHLECALTNVISAGDHSIFVGDIVAAEAGLDLFDEYWRVEKIELITHLGGKMYAKIKENIQA